MAVPRMSQDTARHHQPCTITRLLFGALLLCGVSTMVGQAPEQAAGAEALLGELVEIATVSDIPSGTRCSTFSGSVANFCKGALALKRAELADDANAALDAELQLRDVVQHEPDWSPGWYAIGMARIGLARFRAPAKPSPLQVLGMSWEAGAGHALVRALELDSNSTNAATALAMIPIPREGPSQLGGRLRELRRGRRLLGPVAMAGAARIEFAMGHPDSAAALWQRLLESGVLDGGLVATEYAKYLYAADRPDEGRQVLLAGAATHSEAGMGAYRTELQWVADSAELVEWDATPPADRPVWLRRFWAGRDVREGWPDGARLIEHYKRLVHAMKEFTLQLPPSGRQRSASTTGGIDTFFDLVLDQRLGSLEGEILGETNPEIRTATLAADQYKALGLDSPFRAFRTTQEVLDDRGIVWIRYGKPTRMAASVGGEALQVWAYDNVSPRLVVQFREENFTGQVSASRLVSSLINMPARFRDQFCGIEASLCAANTASPETRRGSDASLEVGGVGELIARDRTDGGRITVATVDRVVREGNAQLTRATTSDANPYAFAGQLTPRVQLLGLTQPATAMPVVLAVFAIPAEQLAWTQPPAAGGRTVYSIRMRVVLLDQLGQRIEVDTLRHFAVLRPLEKGLFLTGTLEVPISAGRHLVSLTLTQEDGRGAVASLAGIGMPGEKGKVEISSIVLGQKGSGAVWRAGETVVALNPLGAFTEKGDAELYYQVRGVFPGTRYTTTLEFVEASAPEKSALTLRFDDDVREPSLEVQRTVGLKNLKPGRYLLRVSVRGGGRTTTETSWLTVVGR